MLIRFLWLAAAILTGDGIVQLANYLRADPLQPWGAAMEAALIANGLTALSLLWRKRYGPAFQVMIWGVWLFISALTLISGVRTPNLMTYPLLIFGSGWLLNFRTAAVMAGLTLMVVFASIIAEATGSLLALAFEPPTVLATSVAVLIITPTLFTYYTLDAYKRSLRAASQLGEALGESENKLSYVMSVAGQSIWQWDIEKGRIKLGRYWCQLLGFDDSHLEQSVADFILLVHEDDREAAGVRVQSCLEGGGPYHIEHRMRRMDGSVVWVDAYGDVFERAADGRPLQMLGGVTDITGRKRAEEQLVAAKAEAERANRAKSHFLAAASHDLRQPLLALSLYVGVLKKMAAEETCQVTGKIEECAEHLSEMLTDLLDVSKLEAGVVKPTLSDFAVDELLMTLASVHAAEAEMKGLELRLRRSGAVAHSDLQLFRRIVGNLVANAIRFTDRGGVLIAHRRYQGKQWVEVWDTGIGIAPEQTGIIFEEFRQLDASRNRGTGLGLAIAARTAALLGLAIRVKSRPGRGSMFAIELPPGRAPLAAVGAAATAAARGLRLGLVEDNEMVLQALVMALQSSGHEVIAASSGKELVQALGALAPDMVISDYRLMADETGYDAIAAVREIFGEDLPAIIVTGDTDPALLRRMATRGIAVHYKPLNVEALLKLIAQAAERQLPQTS